MKLFSTFASHDAVRCFNCNARLKMDYRDDSWHLSGKYSAECVGGCGLRTWYDLDDNEGAQNV